MYELVVNASFVDTKNTIDELMKGLGFDINYESDTDAIAQRGSFGSSVLFSPLSGRKNIAVKFKLTFGFKDGKSTVILEDVGSGLGKALTLTGGATKKNLQDTYTTLKEGLGRRGMI